MAIATQDTNSVALYVHRDTELDFDLARTNTGNWQALRYTSSSLIHNKNTVQSETITTTRDRAASIRVADNAEGDLGFELAYGTELEILAEGIFTDDTFEVGTDTQSAQTAASRTGTTTTLNNASNWSTEITVGTWLQWSALTGATGTGAKYTRALTAGGGTTLDVYDPDGTNNLENTTAYTVKWNYLRNGSDKTLFTFEQDYTDLTPASGTDVSLIYDKVRFNEFTLNVASQQIVTATLSMLGKEGLRVDPSLANAAGIDAAGTNVPFNASGDVQELLIEEAGGGLLRFAGGARSVTLTLNQNLRLKNRIASRYPFDSGLGFFDATGSVEVYMEDEEFFADYVGHTAAGIALLFLDNSSSDTVEPAVAFSVPSLRWSTGSPPVPGGNDDVIQTAEFFGEITGSGATAYTAQFDSHAGIA